METFATASHAAEDRAGRREYLRYRTPAHLTTAPDGRTRSESAFCVKDGLTAVRESDSMKVLRVDPRDAQWEDVHPVFRVYFWDGTDAWSSDEYEVADADVAEVLAWARSQLPVKGTEFTVYLQRREADRVGLVLLAGRDPTAPGEPPSRRPAE